MEYTKYSFLNNTNIICFRGNKKGTKVLSADDCNKLSLATDHCGDGCRWSSHRKLRCQQQRKELMIKKIKGKDPSTERLVNHAIHVSMSLDKPIDEE